MKILSIVSSFYPYRGGSGLGHYDLLSRLTKKYNYKVTVITYNYSQPTKTRIANIASIEVCYLACWAHDNFITIPRPSISNTVAFFWLVGRKYNLIYTRSRYSPTTVIGALLAIIKRIPHLHTEVAIPLPYRIKWYSGIFACILNKTIGKWMLQHSVCVAVSQSAALSMAKTGAKNIKVIYNGIDKSIFYPEVGK